MTLEDAWLSAGVVDPSILRRLGMRPLVSACYAHP
jgi:hypothetical protein